MRVGTPGFVPERLIEAREARELTQTSLSELTGLKSQSISHYEQGRQSPSPEALARLCEKLELPQRYFLNRVPARGSNGIFFRSFSAPARVARLKARRRLGWLNEISGYDGQNVELPNFTQALYEARELAMTRMQDEATQLQASGIVGVRLEEKSHQWGSHTIEFLAIGTAVTKRSGEVTLPKPTTIISLDN